MGTPAIESVAARLRASNSSDESIELSLIYILSSVESLIYIPVPSGDSPPISRENSAPSFVTKSALTAGLSSPHSAADFAVTSLEAVTLAAELTMLETDEEFITSFAYPSRYHTVLVLLLEVSEDEELSSFSSSE